MTTINPLSASTLAVEQLARHPYLQGLPADIAPALARDAVRFNALAGDILFDEGAPASHYLYVVSGQTEVMRYGYNGDERVFRVFEPGQLMAEAAMFMEHGRYPMQARARTDASGWRLSRARLHEACLRWPQLAIALLGVLSKTVYDQVNKVDWITSSSAPERLADYLVQQYERQGIALQLPLSQRQLAALLGIRAETLSRLLNDWQTRNYISGQRRQWVLHDLAYLQRLASTARRPF